MENTLSKSVVFITGAFVSHTCWDEWKNYFESKGYHCIAPPWPHKDAPAGVLRARQPDVAVASIRLQLLVDHYAGIIQKMPGNPILIGHSLGGLITQLLLQKGLGAAGVAIHSVPPQGLFSLKFSFLKAAWGPLGLFTPAKKSFLMSFKQWQYAFTNGMTLFEQQEAYKKFTIPESKLAARDGLSKAAKVDFQRSHVPLLLLSGTEDHIMPASLNFANYRKYRKGNEASITEYKEFAGRNHFVLGQPGWRENADFILHWIEKIDGVGEGPVPPTGEPGGG